MRKQLVAPVVTRLGALRGQVLLTLRTPRVLTVKALWSEWPVEATSTVTHLQFLVLGVSVRAKMSASRIVRPP